MIAIPLAVVLGVNFLDAPRAARGLFLDLLAHADDRGMLALAQGQTPERAAALASPGEDPTALLAELVRVGVVTVQPAAIVLSVGERTHVHVTEQLPPQDKSSKEEKRRADARARAKAWRDSYRARVIEADGTTTRTHESTQAYAESTHTRTHAVHTSLSSLSVSEISFASTGNKTEISDKKEERNAREDNGVRTEYAPSTHQSTHTRTHESTQAYAEPLSLSAPAAPKAKRLQSPQPKLPWSISAMLAALSESSGGAFVVAPFDSSLSAPLSLVIRRLHEAECTLDDVRLVGEWAKAGAFHWMAGSLPGLSWLAKAGNLSSAVGQARAWRDGGKRPIIAQGNRPAHKPAGQAMSAAYASPGEALAKGLHSLEVIRTLRERDAAAAAAKAAAKAAEQRTAAT